MAIKFEVPGKERKKLALATAAWSGEEVRYLGAPTFTYAIGEHITLDKDGNLENDGLDESAFERLVEHLVEIGFECDMSTASDEPEEENPTYLDISVPVSELTDAALDNLEAIVKAKGGLIRKAVKADSLNIVELRDEVHFPWFSIESTAEESQAYILFIEKLIAMAKNAKRVTAKEKDTDNDKYAFRCFLLRLGFIGDEYKAARRILLKNLTGSSAFKSGKEEESCSE